MRLRAWAIAAGVVGLLLLAFWLGKRYWPSSTPVSAAAAVDLGGAVAACERAANNRFGGAASVAVDDHSTRFDKRARLYKIFLEARMSNGGRTVRYLINCYVAPGTGAVSQFEALKDSDSAPGGGRLFWFR